MTKAMTLTKTDIAVAVYDLRTQAENAVKALRRAGFNMKKISIIGRDNHTEEHVVGFLNASDRAEVFGKLLMAVGIPKVSVLRYEIALKADRFMLVVHGGAQEIKRAHELLETSGLASFDHHRGQTEVAASVHA